MKAIQYKTIFTALIVALAFTSCSDDDNNSSIMMNNDPDFSGTYVQQDQMGRPAVNTVFVSSGSKDNFNTTVPSMMGATFQSAFQSLGMNNKYTKCVKNLGKAYAIIIPLGFIFIALFHHFNH